MPAVVSTVNFFKQLIARKPMNKLQPEIEINNELNRGLNLVELIGIGVGATIGAGILTLSGQAAAIYAGPSVIISFLITSIVALLSALSFSELAAMMAHSGAAYTYTYAALGEYLAWFIGWNYVPVYLFGAFTVLAGWSEHVVHLINLLTNYNVTSRILEAPVTWNEEAKQFFVTGQIINLPAIIITIAITILLIIGIRQTARVNLVLVVIKIIILLIFIFACCKYVNLDNYKPFFPSNQGSFDQYGITGMLKACTYVFFAQTGFDSVAAVAQEARNPQRSVPRATIASVIISLLIYIGISTVMVGLIPYKLLDTDNPLSDAISATPYGLWLLILMDLGAIASLTTVALIMILSQTRILYAMAHDGLLPPIFAKILRRRDTPWISTIICGIFCAIISGVCAVDIIGETTSISALITYLFVHIEVIVMRYTHPAMQRTFKVSFGSWLIPIIGSLLCILLMTDISKETGFRLLVWTAIGQIVYFSYGFWHSKIRQPKPEKSIVSTVELLPIDENTPTHHNRYGSEPHLAIEMNETNSNNSRY